MSGGVPPPGLPSPLDFFVRLAWIDGRPLMDAIEHYRREAFGRALYSFDADGAPTYNLVLAGRGKKNWKSADLILAGLYRFLIWESPLGNDGYLIANDEGQAGDDLALAKRLVEANPEVLGPEIEVLAKSLRRRDGRGDLQVLPARDVAGLHGKSYLFCGYDEIHGYRTWDVLEALAPDPTRRDSLQWISSYASIFNSPGAPLYDLIQQGKRGEDPRMFFSWYAADLCTDPAFADLPTPEERANPSMTSWGDDGYLDQQRRRLPSHKYRRLHLNLPGLPDGAALDADRVMDAIVPGRRALRPEPGLAYVAFVDMSGGSGDDATLAIGHKSRSGERIVLDLVQSQTGAPPFNPRKAVLKFADTLRTYGLDSVMGDRYAGQTFVADFEAADVGYLTCPVPKSNLYEDGLEPALNAGEVELLDVPRLQEQALGLIWRGSKIDHQPGEHDDWINAAAGVVWRLRPQRRAEPRVRFLGDDVPVRGVWQPLR